jgi:hypothetical protein
MRSGPGSRCLDAGQETDADCRGQEQPRFRLSADSSTARRRSVTSMRSPTADQTQENATCSRAAGSLNAWQSNPETGKDILGIESCDIHRAFASGLGQGLGREADIKAQALHAAVPDTAVGGKKSMLKETVSGPFGSDAPDSTAFMARFSAVRRSSSRTALAVKSS